MAAQRGYHCDLCKDTGHIIWKDSGLCYSCPCPHPGKTGVPFSFPKGTWAHAGPLPQALSAMQQSKDHQTVLITNKPKYAIAAALDVATALRHRKPRYLDAMKAPSDFRTSPEAWINLYSNNNLLIIDSVDRRLRPAQVRSILELIHHKERSYILIGDPASQHPDNEPWLALSTELHRQQAKVITI